MFEKFAQMKSFFKLLSVVILFFFRNHPGEASQKSRLNEVEKIYGFAFDLRLQRKFDDANKLEALVDSILEKQGDWEVSELHRVGNWLQFYDRSSVAANLFLNIMYTARIL